MGYRQTRYDPDYESPDFPPPTPRKRRWYLINVFMMLLIPFFAFSGLITQRWFVLLWIWGGAAVSAAFGVIINPNISLFEEDDPKGFWRVYTMLLVACIVMTYFVLRDPGLR